jgi:hypothetical protein
MRADGGAIEECSLHDRKDEAVAPPADNLTIDRAREEIAQLNALLADLVAAPEIGRRDDLWARIMTFIQEQECSRTR